MHSLLTIPYSLLGGREEFWRIFRYLLAGAWNTLFGMGVYALLVSFKWGEEHYMLMAVPGNIIAISNAFLCYKLFVFKTKGRWLREYFRCYLVYGAAALGGFALLCLFAELCGMHPAIANCIGIAITTACSYFGHKLFSFRRPAAEPTEAEDEQNVRK